jgi:polyketide cyclase/dehydrase/lipid transport protein
VLKVILIVVAVLVLLAVAVVIAGYALPVGHVASRQAVVKRSPEVVFDAVADVARYPDWRPDVSTVDVLSPEPLRWREHGANGDITYRRGDESRPSRLVAQIDDPSLPFGGSWSYDLAPHPSGTLLTITEHGEVYNPLFRVMSRYVFGDTATIDAYLAALEKRFP